MINDTLVHSSGETVDPELRQVARNALHSCKRYTDVQRLLDFLVQLDVNMQWGELVYTALDMRANFPNFPVLYDKSSTELFKYPGNFGMRNVLLGIHWQEKEWALQAERMGSLYE